jgi:uncharacterized protein (TIGR03435 family)
MEGLIVGGPGWIDTDRFEVDATMAPGTSADDMRTMARALLADRFKLVTHPETRDMLVFALVVARIDRKLGPQLQPATVDCNALREAQRRGEAPPPVPPNPGEAPAPCMTGFRIAALARIESGGMTMTQLAASLSQSTGRPVIDRTGLSGDYVVTLEFARDPGLSSPLGPVPAGAPAAPVDAPSVFVAVQEQLGLKLEARREPTEVLVIDNADQPTPD